MQILDWKVSRLGKVLLSLCAAQQFVLTYPSGISNFLISLITCSIDRNLATNHSMLQVDLYIINTVCFLYILARPRDRPGRSVEARALCVKIFKSYCRSSIVKTKGIVTYILIS